MKPCGHDFFCPTMSQKINNSLTPSQRRGRIMTMTRQVSPDFPVAFLSGAFPGGSRLKRGGNL